MNHSHPHTHSATCSHTHSHEGNGHGHDHHHEGPHVHPVVKNLTLALLLNLSFTIIEFIGGLATNSVAILSDAVHDLGDSIAIAVAMWLEKHSLKGRTPSYTYGNRRFSPFAATITSVILVAGSVFIISEAIPRFWHPEPVSTGGMMWLAILGLIFNGAAALKLSKGSDSLNQKAVMLHLLEDVLGWVAVLAGSIIMHYTQWYWIDPLLSLAVAVFILYNAVRNLRSSFRIFMQATPKNIHPGQVEEALLQIPDVIAVHDLHLWTMDGSYIIFSGHLVVADTSGMQEAARVRREAIALLQSQGIQHATLQVETSDEHCGLERC
ncbi:cation diffusion facilitator family transporter [Filimonas effusa]|uniref:Cation transporter n=1 Tax=Filimonas effusa TaxID=2508721 RepID=A0A4Q1D8L8_9BACT|nr:cation diffusion facilitator family transporter [Filimonas effusa]RXK85672.1 cation transporter [Filimonas effusa]